MNSGGGQVLPTTNLFNLLGLIDVVLLTKCICIFLGHRGSKSAWDPGCSRPGDWNTWL